MLVLPRSGFRYASFAGPIPGGLTAGTLLLVIVTASGDGAGGGLCPGGRHPGAAT
ncbi:MAG TPA: hypothetical protein VI030_15875 [Propionibacteriaceae bacterium]